MVIKSRNMKQQFSLTLRRHPVALLLRVLCVRACVHARRVPRLRSDLGPEGSLPGQDFRGFPPNLQLHISSPSHYALIILSVDTM
jgi:hypothetical protein